MFYTVEEKKSILRISAGNVLYIYKYHILNEICVGWCTFFRKVGHNFLSFIPVGNLACVFGLEFGTVNVKDLAHTWSLRDVRCTIKLLMWKLIRQRIQIDACKERVQIVLIQKGNSRRKKITLKTVIKKKPLKTN